LETGGTRWRSDRHTRASGRHCRTRCAGGGRSWRRRLGRHRRRTWREIDRHRLAGTREHLSGPRRAGNGNRPGGRWHRTSRRRWRNRWCRTRRYWTDRRSKSRARRADRGMNRSAPSQHRRPQGHRPRLGFLRAFLGFAVFFGSDRGGFRSRLCFRLRDFRRGTLRYSSTVTNGAGFRRRRLGYPRSPDRT
jgi:hypothetical protein